MGKDKISQVFEETYRNYLKEIEKLDFPALATRMETGMEGESIPVPLFGKPYLVSKSGITGPDGKEPIHSEKVLLCKYVLMYPEDHPRDEAGLISYRDFREAAPFVGGFKSNSELPVARNFSDRLKELKKACLALGGTDPDAELNYDLCMKFDALPRVPIVLLFNDQDEEFPASALILFERRADKYLDMECLAIAGWLLADYLYKYAGDIKNTIM